MDYIDSAAMMMNLAARGRLAERWGYLQTQLPLTGRYIFRSARGGPYDSKSVYGIVKAALMRAQIAKAKMGPHILRHTFATLLLQTGRVDLVTLQNLLGHGHLQTVLVCAHADSGPMRAAMERFPVG